MMKILAATLFIALAVFPNSVELSGRPANEQGQGSHIPPVEFYEDMPEGLFYKQTPNSRRFHPIQPGFALYQLGPYIIGMIQGADKVVPVFNDKKEVVMYNKDTKEATVIGHDGAATFFGIPGTIESVGIAVERSREWRRTVEAAENQGSQASGSQSSSNSRGARPPQPPRGGRGGRGGRGPNRSRP